MIRIRHLSRSDALAHHGPTKANFPPKSIRFLKPQALLTVAAAILFGFTLVPKDVYEHYVIEPDLMLNNLSVYGLLFISLFILWIGVRFSYLLPRVQSTALSRLIIVTPFTFLFIPALLALLLLALTSGVILHNDPAILWLALSGHGEAIKEALKTAGKGAFNGSLPLAMGVSWWTLGYYQSLARTLSQLQRWIIWILTSFLISALLFVAFLTASRFIMMPTLFGLFLIWLRYRIIEVRMGSFALVLMACGALIVVLGLFGAIAATRSGEGGGFALIQDYLGYGPASLNHLAALLSGRLSTDSLGHYLAQENFGFFYKFPLVAKFFNEGAVLQSAINSCFRATWAAGLNGNFIWFTSFGEIFAGLGIYGVPYLFLYGVFLGRAWLAFRSGKFWGLILYPWAAFGVLFSFGSNYFAGQPLTILIFLAAILTFYGAIVRVRTTGQTVNFRNLVV